eukprot:TRINITY_DN50307_c0_g1_i2.p2 TRINITY_DN50307_c0_g1~~TRINITY_DN50307_c0_g1_i2.p2  ORF type:complete len:108 (+),score=24.19 TRINITY_DN50307_c0_g1_i2:177-500(+)
MSGQDETLSKTQRVLLVLIGMSFALRPFVSWLIGGFCSRETVDTVEELASCVYMTLLLVFLEASSGFLKKKLSELSECEEQPARLEAPNLLHSATSSWTLSFMMMAL